MDRLTSRPGTGEGEPVATIAEEDMRQLEAELEATSGERARLPAQV